MAKTKLNNVLSFKDYTSLSKLENKPGKTFERYDYDDYYDYNEGFFTDTKIGNKVRKGLGFKNYDEKFEETEQEILDHPVKKDIYLDMMNKDPEKARKYIEFFMKNPQGYPKWENGEFVDTGIYSYGSTSF